MKAEQDPAARRLGDYYRRLTGRLGIDETPPVLPERSAGRDRLAPVRRKAPPVGWLAGGAAVAAAVALIVVGVVALGSGGGSARTSSFGPTARSGSTTPRGSRSEQAVPGRSGSQVSGPKAGPRQPSPSFVSPPRSLPSPVETHPPNTALPGGFACQAANLTASWGGIRSSAGELSFTVDLRSTGSAPCGATGIFGVELLGRRGGRVVTAPSSIELPVIPTVTLKPGGVAHFAVVIGHPGHPECGQVVSSLVLSPPHSPALDIGVGPTTLTLRVPVPLTYCTPPFSVFPVVAGP